MVALMIAPLAAETILDEGPVISKPSADWIKFLIADESNSACFMASSMTSFLAWQCILVAFLFSIRCASHRANFERRWGLSADSSFKRVVSFSIALLIFSGGLVIPAVTR